MITVSIVSHLHAPLLPNLVNQLLGFPEIGLIIITLNVPETLELSENSRIKIIENANPKGFGANHNLAFKFNHLPYFCVLNPDVVFEENPFPLLLPAFKEDKVGLVAPLAKTTRGHREPSIRHFVTPLSLLRKYAFGYDDSYLVENHNNYFYPDWVSGMFMLFDSKVYKLIHGFDEKYFLYCEDVDVCLRTWLAGYRISACSKALVIHDADRASHKSWQYTKWHLSSMMRFFYNYWKNRQHIKPLRC